jgi:hypothetical protein
MFRSFFLTVCVLLVCSCVFSEEVKPDFASRLAGLRSQILAGGRLAAGGDKSNKRIEFSIDRAVQSMITGRSFGRLAGPSVNGAASTSVPVPIVSCGNNGDLVTVNSVTSTSWPPTGAQNLCISYTVNQAFQSGSAAISVTWNGLPIYNKQTPFTLPAPINPGSNNLCHSVNIPTWLSGDVKAKIVLNSSAGQEINCQNLEIKF